MSPPLLQPGMPGAPEFLVVLFVFMLSIALLVGASYWVYRDAKGRGNDSAALWAVLTGVGFFVGLFPGIAVVLAYLYFRD